MVNVAVEDSYQGQDAKIYLALLDDDYQFAAAADADEATLKETALTDERIVRFIDGKPLKKVIVVRNKLVNIVV